MKGFDNTIHSFQYILNLGIPAILDIPIGFPKPRFPVTM